MTRSGGRNRLEGSVAVGSVRTSFRSTFPPKGIQWAFLDAVLLTGAAMAKMLTVSGADGDLFMLASREYGDASAWLAIAEANGLETADLPEGITELVIPAWQAGFSGGVPG